MSGKRKLLILPYRRLDFDDIILLSMLSPTVKFSVISDRLSISRSAISHRLNKYRFLFDGFEVEVTRHRKILSNKAIDLSRRAREVLAVLLTIGESNVKTDNQEEQSN